MSYPIPFTAAMIRLQSLFQATGSLGTREPAISEMVVPTVEITPFLSTIQCIDTNVNVSAGAAAIATVPSNQVWYVWGVSKAATASATRVYLTIPASAAAGFTVLGSGTTANTVTFATPIYLPPGSVLYLSQGGGGDVNINCNLAAAKLTLPSSASGW